MGSAYDKFNEEAYNPPDDQPFIEPAENRSNDYATPTKYLSKTEECCRLCGLVIELRIKNQKYHKECKRIVDDRCAQVFRTNQQLYAVRKQGFLFVGVQKLSVKELSDKEIMGILGISLSKDIIVDESGRFRGVRSKTLNCPNCGTQLINSERYFKYCRSCELFFYAFRHKGRMTSVERKEISRVYDMRNVRDSSIRSENKAMYQDSATNIVSGPYRIIRFCNFCRKETGFESDNTAPPPFRNYMACVECGNQPSLPPKSFRVAGRGRRRGIGWKTRR